MSTLVSERVARGAAWLDGVRPGWRDAVSLPALNMRDGTRCICGQVFAEDVKQPGYACGYGFALIMGRTPADKAGWGADWSVEHGFTTHDEDAWGELQREWKLQIHASRAAKAELAHA